MDMAITGTIQIHGGIDAEGVYIRAVRPMLDKARDGFVLRYTIEAFKDREASQAAGAERLHLADEHQGVDRVDPDTVGNLYVASYLHLATLDTCKPAEAVFEPGQVIPKTIAGEIPGGMPPPPPA